MNIEYWCSYTCQGKLNIMMLLCTCQGKLNIMMLLCTCQGKLNIMMLLCTCQGKSNSLCSVLTPSTRTRETSRPRNEITSDPDITAKLPCSNNILNNKIYVHTRTEFHKFPVQIWITDSLIFNFESVVQIWTDSR